MLNEVTIQKGVVLKDRRGLKVRPAGKNVLGTFLKGKRNDPACWTTLRRKHGVKITAFGCEDGWVKVRLFVHGLLDHSFVIREPVTRSTVAFHVSLPEEDLVFLITFCSTPDPTLDSDPPERYDEGHI